MLIKLKVHPDSKRSALVKKSDDAYEAWVKAPAANGLANRAALSALSAALGRPAAALHIVKGATSPNKIIRVWDITT